MENAIVMQPRERVPGQGIFASFLLGNSEFAVDVACVQEVVNYPGTIARMPLAPPYLDGIFNLRGTIVPVVDPGVLLKCPGAAGEGARKIAILNIAGANVGLAFDATGEIMRPSADELSLFEGKAANGVIGGVIRMNGGQRLVQILDAAAVLSIENLPLLQGRASGMGDRVVSFSARRKLGNRRKCITFCVAGARLAFEITGIHEIVLVPEIQGSALASDICLGLVNLRGQTIPVISFAAILGCAPASADQDESKRRIIVLKIEHELFGLLVDSVEDISFYSPDEIMPVPLFSQERMEMFLGCIAAPESGDVLLLDQARILENREILEITSNHAKIYQAEESSTAGRAGGEKRAYISFMLNHRFGIPISEVREIIEYPDAILATPGVPSYVLGVVNLRGELVSIIDARKLYGMPGKYAGAAETRKILVIQRGDSRYGLVVDSVESIVHVDQNDKTKIPDLLVRMMGDVEMDFSEVIQIPGGGGMVILNLGAVLNRVDAG